jgi:HK97 family phage portal protein
VRNPLKRKALTSSAGAIDAIRNPSWNAYPLLGGGARDRIQNIFNRAQSANYGWMYSHSPAVRTVVDVIVRNVGQLELRLFEEVSQSERQPRPDHPAALSLRYPNETTTADGFIRSLFKDYLIYDNAYALLVPGTGDRITLIRIPAFMVEVMGSSLFQAEVYRVWPQGAWMSGGMWGGGGTSVDYAPENILHWHGEHPLDPRIGLSHLDTLRDVIAEDAALQQATVELANSGLTEPIWAYRPLDAPELDPEIEDRLSEDLTNKVYSRNRRVVVTQEGTELRSFGVSPQDAQMLEVRRWAVERVATAFGVPLAIVGLGTGRAENLADAQAQLYTDTLLPYCQDFSKMLDQRILVRAYNWTDGAFEFSFDEKLMGNDRLRALTSASGRAVMLTNEARAKLNLPPIEGGDELVTPLNVIVGDNPKPSPQVMPTQDPGGPPQDGSQRENPPKALTTHHLGALGDVLQRQIDLAAHVIDRKASEDVTPLPQLHPSRKAELDRQLRNIDEFQAVAVHHFDRLTKALERTQRAKADPPDWRRWDREFADDIHKTLETMIAREGTLYAFKLGGKFDTGQVENYLRAMAEGSAEAINSTIRDEVKTIGIEGAIARFPAHVESAGTGLGANATRFARTEAARQSPTPELRVKTWIPHTARHAQFGGQTVPLGDDWPAGFAPGTAPGCKCSMTIE